MEKEILIIKNTSIEGPGLLLSELKYSNIKYSIIDLSRKEKLPNPENFAAVIVLGGQDSANDNTDKIKNELIFVKKVISSQIPYLGICLGLQILVKATGGKVINCPVKEIGFKDIKGKHYSVTLTNKGEKDPLFINLDQTLNVFHLHSETVELTDDMTLLAAGRYCKNQIVKVGLNAYGIQGHFELTPEMFDFWIKTDPELSRINQTQIRKDFKSIQKKYTETGRFLFRNFLKLISKYSTSAPV